MHRVCAYIIIIIIIIIIQLTVFLFLLSIVVHFATVFSTLWRIKLYYINRTVYYGTYKLRTNYDIFAI